MALTSGDETDLILPLYQGVYENPLFSTFLERLKRRTGAEYVALKIRHGDSSIEDFAEFFAGMDLWRGAREMGIEHLHMLDRTHHDRLRLGRVYSVAEFVDHDPVYKAQRADGIERLGITDERVVRVVEEDGIHAWLTLAREKSCTASDSALLSTLAPYVAVALRGLVQLERQRIETAMSAEGLGRFGAGWIVFDRDATVLAIHPETSRRLRDIAHIKPQPGERLRDTGIDVERELSEAAEAFAEAPESPARTIVLNNAPRVEALLLPARNLPIAVLARPVMFALCRFPQDPSLARSSALARLFGLPQREAELAIALSDGLSIAEAADAMGLTLETTRNYSKRLYAKLGVRGQAELVRLVYESTAVLA